MIGSIVLLVMETILMHQIGMGQLLENIALGTNLGTYWVFLIKFSYIGLTEPTLRMLLRFHKPVKHYGCTKQM